MLTSLSIRFKLGFALTVLTGLTLLLGITNYYGLRTLDSNTSTFASQFMTAQGAILNADRDLYQAVKAQQDALLINQGEDISDLKATFDENAQQALDRMNVYRKEMQGDSEIISKLNEFDAKFKAWHLPAESIFSLVKQGDMSQAKQITLSIEGAFSSLRDQYDIAGELLIERSKELHEMSNQVTSSRVSDDIIISVISLLIGVLLIFFIPRSIAGSIDSIRTKIDDISKGEGDLVSRIPVTSKDELGQLAISFNHLLDQLQQLIRQVIKDVGDLQGNTGHLETISQRTETNSANQVTHLSTLSDSFTEIGHSVGEIASNAQNTAAKSQEALMSAKDGVQKIDSTIALNRDLSSSIQLAGERVEKLSSESEQITSVLDVIRNIADQTNLLALNAAIEAARAGDQGRGFAVVADEVRTLAQRTQDSTEHIQTMFTSLREGVVSTKSAMDSGCELMDESLSMTEDMRHSFEDIQSLVTTVQDMNNQIAYGTDQQNNLVHSVNLGVEQLHNLTVDQSDVAASVSDTGNAVARLTSQLSERVSKFKV